MLARIQKIKRVLVGITKKKKERRKKVRRSKWQQLNIGIIFETFIEKHKKEAKKPKVIGKYNK